LATFIIRFITQATPVHPAEGADAAHV